VSTRDESIRQLQAGIAALANEDHCALSDAALAEQIGQLVAIWDQVDGYVTQMANTVIARTFGVSEVVTAS
jgi:hypothetical protein